MFQINLGGLSPLCDDPSEGMSAEWNATVAFQGLTATCLGLDYMLRAEQVSDGTVKCSQLQGQYMDQCCYPSDQVPASNSCQLCKNQMIYCTMSFQATLLPLSNLLSQLPLHVLQTIDGQIGKECSRMQRGKTSFLFFML